MRHTKKTVERRFREFCNAIGVQVGYKQGNWFIESAPMGGYRIVKMLEGRGHSHPFGETLRGAREMCDTLNFAMRAIAWDRDPEKASNVYWPDYKCWIN